MTQEGYYTNNISLECCAYWHSGQTYIFPDLINQMVRCRFPNDIRSYNTVKTFKNGKLSNVTEENKYYVQWQFARKCIEFHLVVYFMIIDLLLIAVSS
jgi:hypothetical protein